MVRLLAEEEERLVEPADVIDRPPADEQARAHHPVDLAFLVVRESPGVEGVQGLQAGASLRRKKYSVAIRHAVESPGPSAAASRPGCAGAGDHGRVVPPLGRRDQRLERARRQPGVGVEDQDVLAHRLGDAPVPAGPMRGSPARGAERAVVMAQTSTVPSVDPWSTTTVSLPSGAAGTLDPRQRVERDDDVATSDTVFLDRAAPPQLSRSRITPPGRASATVTRK